MRDGAAGIRVGEAGRDGLAHVDFVGEVVPGCGFWQRLDEVTSVRFDVGVVSHTRKVKRGPARGKQRRASRDECGHITPELTCERIKQKRAKRAIRRSL